MNLAIIPARGGSKRIPRKNIRAFCGKPIIAWSIQAAQQSRCFDRIIVSTDDIEIAEIARTYGAEVPFLRPTELADEYTDTSTVIRHAVAWLQAQGHLFDNVCCLYATAPFVREIDLLRGLQIFEHSGADFALSVTSYAFPIQRALRMTNAGGLEMLLPEHLSTRSQDLEVIYHDAGQFYWGRAAAWMNNKPLFSPQSVPVVLPRHLVQDIDTQEDWERIEWMWRAMQLSESKQGSAIASLEQPSLSQARLRPHTQGRAYRSREP